jgi:hypothetical protein
MGLDSGAVAYIPVVFMFLVANVVPRNRDLAEVENLKDR